jgi:hypothetical protein
VVFVHQETSETAVLAVEAPVKLVAVTQGVGIAHAAEVALN